MSADARDFCPDCDGSGVRRLDPFTDIICITCKGTGRFR